MGYIIKLVSKDSEKEKNQITEIARRVFKNIEAVEIRKYLEELEKYGYLFCRKIEIE